MSTFIGKVNNKPFMHMTSDTKSEADMQGDPTSTTLFHSSLPYVLVTAQWEIDTYTDWNGIDGGRKFAIPSEAQAYRSSNPNDAYLVVLEDANGHTTVFNPAFSVASGQYEATPGGTVYSYNAAMVGIEYTIAFTSSDTQLEALTTNFFSNSTLGRSLTFRLWGGADTSLTVFRQPKMGTWFYDNGVFSNIVPFVADPTPDSSLLYQQGEAKNAESFNNDIVKVRLVFLNITNSANELILKNNIDDTAGITIKNNEFSVGGIDLLSEAPLLARGVKDYGQVVTPVYGKCIGNKTLVVNLTDKAMGKVDASGVVQDDNTPVIEMPNPAPATPYAEFDLKDQILKLNGSTVFSAVGAAEGLIISGYKQIDFSLNTQLAGTQNGITFSIPLTATGSFDNVTANTMYLMSIKYYTASGSLVTPMALIGAGETEIFNDFVAVDSYIGSTRYSFSGAYSFYVSIDETGDILMKRKQSYKAGTLSGATFDFGDIELRFIALNPA